MKVLSSYFKEMKIASRGMYFYVDFILAFVILAVLFLAIKDNPQSKEKEFLYYDMSIEARDTILAEYIDKGELVKENDTEFTVKPNVIELASLEFENMDVAKIDVVEYKDEKNISVLTYSKMDLKNNKLDKKLYIMENKEDLLRLAYDEKSMGAVISIDENFEPKYEYYTQGAETKRLYNLLAVFHNEDIKDLEQQFDNQNLRYLEKIELLSTRQNLVPILVIYSSALVGLFIIMAYIFMDKEEGTIQALAVAPGTVSQYLISKIGVIYSITIPSALIIVVPIIGKQANYFLFLTILITSLFFCITMGTVIGSFFKSLIESFGALFAAMLFLAVPIFSYYIPSFNPEWMKFVPSYYMLESVKETFLITTNSNFVLLSSAGFLIGGCILFAVSIKRFEKTLIN